MACLVGAVTKLAHAATTPFVPSTHLSLAARISTLVIGPRISDIANRGCTKIGGDVTCSWCATRISQLYARFVFDLGVVP